MPGSVKRAKAKVDDVIKRLDMFLKTEGDLRMIHAVRDLALALKDILDNAKEGRNQPEASPKPVRHRPEMD
jgi:hypothetical protein